MFTLDIGGHVIQSVGTMPSSVYITESFLGGVGEMPNSQTSGTRSRAGSSVSRPHSGVNSMIPNSGSEMVNPESGNSFALQHIRRNVMDTAFQKVVDHGALAFDLERGPLHRFTCVSIDEDQHIFGASFHRIVTDGKHPCGLALCR